MTDYSIDLPDGRKTGFAEYGDPHGTPVFYFHGTPGSRLEAGRFHEIAIIQHCRLIGLDRPGMGNSTFDPERTLLAWAKDVNHLAFISGMGRWINKPQNRMRNCMRD